MLHADCVCIKWTWPPLYSVSQRAELDSSLRVARLLFALLPRNVLAHAMKTRTSHYQLQACTARLTYACQRQWLGALGILSEPGAAPCRRDRPRTARCDPPCFVCQVDRRRRSVGSWKSTRRRRASRVRTKRSRCSPRLRRSTRTDPQRRPCTGLSPAPLGRAPRHTHGSLSVHSDFETIPHHIAHSQLRWPG